jgi:transcription attenuation protein (tryptophan RNA-binding attenuator protein)
MKIMLVDFLNRKEEGKQEYGKVGGIKVLLDNGTKKLKLGGRGRMENSSVVSGDYIVVKALENGVTISGLTRGKDTKFHHSEKLDKGEIMIAQFTEHTAAMKIRGRAVVLTKFGSLEAGE